MPGFRHGGNVLVVSAPDIARVQADGVAYDSPLGTQLRHAELLILNHIDRISPSLARSVYRWLQQYAPQSRVVESERCCIPAAMLLGIGLTYAPAHATLGEWTPSYAVDGDRRRSKIAQPRHDDDYRAWVLTTRSPIDARAFRGWVGALPTSVLRGDGIVRLRSDPRHRFQFRLCGSRWSLTPDGSMGDAAPTSWISLVGLASSSSATIAPDAEMRDVTVRAETEPPRVHRRERPLLTLQHSRGPS
jgi:G3E family GTPase